MGLYPFLLDWFNNLMYLVIYLGLIHVYVHFCYDTRVRYFNDLNWARPCVTIDWVWYIIIK